MRAIILAAGSGTRLSPLTDNCPKCLVPMGRDLLLDFQLRALRAVGADDIVLVIGYQSEQVRSYCGTGVRYIENADFATTNSIYSLFMARHELNTDTFLFNCDILFHTDILRRMLAADKANVVAVDAQVERVAGEMNVALNANGLVQAISKKLDPQQAQAQSIQLVKFDTAGALQVGAEVERLVREDQKDAFPTSAYGPIIAAQTLFGVEAGDLPWGEVDTLEDYEHASGRVLPRMEMA